ncbi:hypothetical protein JGI7_01082 [Candidatus Kryptonium thompsonii]|jgi:hypothetical protein|uniref:Uncharacterized protein n=1 Tax=Candidatus Kryptonium thompsonii TaxID=1633631 RepID=A0A0P1L9V6_9BACT|nr:hypothetical protein [Candidatus Kryptonium thompsoni]CUS77886.1 hypothetical protein JGI14_100312 [Candidatus Kryptonium thompsoni]CUS87220.1 hypothetical protein JGI7_01082 [Candidatus Kryptonium thompsoni]CUS87447.1 hypothetical protein JGI10_01362 [Candidatus Kryptonium thompsoni]CUS91449.1 hypothetical protein JGI8_01550 [Candidatus Kryptonium thompsoni]CUS93247.1 hypothetical protein JGI15_10903 [Candidatus Kryptonium thompsoni]
MSKKLIFLLFPAILFAQNLNLRLTTTAYMWQRQETPEISTNHLRAYQLAQLTLSKGNLSFHAFANLSNDFREKQTDDPRFRFYNFYLNWRNIFNRFNLKLGRFAVYSGVGVGTIDGAYINAKIFKFLSANVYGGFLMPRNQKFALNDDPKNNFMFGGQLKFSKGSFNASLSYFNQHRKPKTYEAFRADSLGDVFVQEISPTSSQYQIVSGDLNYEFSSFELYSRLDYDINRVKFSRFEFSAGVNLMERLKLSAGYDYRDPRIPANSIFSVFNYSVTKEIEAGIHYRISPLLRVYVGFSNVNYVDDKAQRIVVGFDAGYGSVNFAKRLGYAGELDGVSAQVYYPMFNNKFIPNASLSYSSYKLWEGGEKHKDIVLALGGNARLNNAISFDIQTQYIQNKVYKSDFRVFFKFNYWLFTNLGFIK